MRIFVLSIISFFLLWSVSGCSQPSDPGMASSKHVNTAIENRAVAIVSSMVANKWAEVDPYLGDQMRASKSLKSVEMTMKDNVSKFGSLRIDGDPTTKYEESFTSVYVPCKYGKTSLYTKIVFGDDEKVAGVWIADSVPQ